ncbi:MAG TPA: cell division protein, partial [Pseudomonadales bacterium]|nr:cell division protein [Pseudomonadales bacterium]
GSPTYVRRPFLYLGFWYGLLGALLAISAVEVLVAGLQVPVTSLANLYQSQFSLHSMSLPLFFEVLALSCMLGIVGAWLEVSLHLYRARPR